MATFNINPLSISFESILSDLQLMIASKPEAFQDFFTDGSGSAVVDMAAALGAYYAYQIITQRRELSMAHAQNYSSLLGNAYDKGYNVSRGNNLWLHLDIIPSYTGYLSKWDVVGSYEDFDLVLMDDLAVFNEGEETSINVVLGNKLFENKTALSNFTIFQFESDDVTDDARLLLNGSEIPFSTDVKDLLDDKFVALSNAYGSVNAFYLQDGEYNYESGDVLTLEYVARNNMNAVDIDKDSLFIADVAINDFSIVKNKVDLENKDTIRINAPLYAETSNVVKARADFKKEILKSNIDLVKSVTDYDVTPGIIALCILKKDGTNLTITDTVNIAKSIVDKRASGIATLIYFNPKKIYKKLHVVITKDLNAVVQDNTLLDSVENLVLSHNDILEEQLDLTQLEKDIEQGLSGVKIARITVDSSAWLPSTSYQLTDNCIATNFDNKSYILSDIEYRTNDTQPDWVEDENGLVLDGRIFWKRWDGDCTGVAVWRPEYSYKKGALISTEPIIVDGEISWENRNVYTCYDYVNYTGTVEPVWQDTITIDNEIVWQKIRSSSTTEEWSANTYKFTGDDIRKLVVEEEPENYALVEILDELIYHYNGSNTTDFYTTEPLAQDVECYQDVELTKSLGIAYNVSEDTVNIINENNSHYDYYRVINFAATSGDIEPDWNTRNADDTITDGRLRWSEQAYPATNLNLKFDNYFELDPDIYLN